MGTWGTSIYSGDFARDLRETTRAAVRLPYNGDQLLRIIRDTVDGVSDDEEDEDYTTFWLVVADQFWRYGLQCEAVFRTAKSIIESGSDIRMNEARDMSSPDLKKRKTALDGLNAKLCTIPTKLANRQKLSRPQPYVMEAGEVFRFPTSEGDAINPYATESDWKRLYNDWKHDGWGAMCVLSSGRAFDYLAWYEFAVLMQSQSVMPDDVTELQGWALSRPGTCSRLHFERMRFEKIGHVLLDAEKLRQRFPVHNGTQSAVRDISIANELQSIPARPPAGYDTNIYRVSFKGRSQIVSLKEIMTR